ncbi:hypothetical protein CSAL01_13363 [Colletotrichum salicis]|uniref:Uncharacterized protein n=1 Tax=Colletotrichum salicis TaxID=1209931 RepID=A0A135UT91_9PEZI|nr:hypothetical protein CSAL01_13363 [Colletotrichum salicis]
MYETHLASSISHHQLHLPQTLYTFNPFSSRPNVKIIVKNESGKVSTVSHLQREANLLRVSRQGLDQRLGPFPQERQPNTALLASRLREHYYAVWGPTRQKGTLETLEIQDGGAVFDKDKIGTLEKDGSFGIDTAAYDFTKYAHAFCGLGMKSPTPDQDEVQPVSVWRAEPHQKYQTTPKRIYYISTGKFVSGRVVDFAQLGTTATIDVTGKKETVATVIYNNELDFLPVKCTPSRN